MVAERIEGTRTMLVDEERHVGGLFEVGIDFSISPNA